MLSLHQRLVVHNQRTREALATREELLAAPWPPGRRWRVEGSPYGNSGLTTRRAAWRLQTRVGGGVVEVLPTQREYWRAIRAEKRRQKAAEAHEAQAR